MSPRQRLVATLRKQLGLGVVQVVATKPGGESRTLESPTIATVCAAADAGFVKLSLLRADGERVAVDARHGGTRAQRRDGLERPAGSPVPASEAPPAAPAGQGPLSPALLRVIDIANADGTVSAQNAKKLKQTRHLVELLRPAWTAARAALREARPLRVLDLACGNAYLSFVLYDALRAEGIACRLHGIEARPALVDNCAARARTLGFDGMSFAASTIGAADLAPLGGPPDLVLALHACDTATDEALALAIRASATSIFVVPCCQAELASQMRGHPNALSPALSRHGMLLNEHAATLTDAIRADLLDALGYAVDVVEFIDAGHTPKNRLLRAHRRTSPAPGRDLAATLERIAALGLRPSLAGMVGG